MGSRARVAVLLLGTLASATVLHLACSSAEETLLAALGGDCLVNSDCNASLICAFKRCHAECNDTRDCPAGQRCIESDGPHRVCQLPEESKCTYNSECVGEQICGIDGQCRDQCASDRDCVPKQVCRTATCADEKELVDGALVPLSSNGGPADGQPCNVTSECPADLVCIASACRKECATDADCAPYVCDLDAGHCNVPKPFCIPGEQIGCDCPDGGTSVQLCASDGLSVGPCVACPVDGGAQ